MTQEINFPPWSARWWQFEPSIEPLLPPSKAKQHLFCLPCCCFLFLSWEITEIINVKKFQCVLLESCKVSRFFLGNTSVQFSSVQFSRSVVSDSLWPHESQHARPPCPSPSPGVHSDSRPSSQWCHPAISSCHPLLLLPSIPPSIRVFSNESTLLMRWPKYWSFSFSIIPSKEIPGLICFRMDWLDLLAVQGTLKSPLQHHSLKASILRG